MSTLTDRRLISAAYELKVAADLLERGLQVFLNSGDSGPADLVAWNVEKNAFAAIDVKARRAAWVRKDGKVNLPQHDSRTGEWLVTVYNGIIHYPTGLSLVLGVELPQNPLQVA